MVHTTVLVPQRNAGAELATRIPRLCQKLATIGRPFEVIVIDDASAPSSNQHLVRMIPDHAALRLIRGTDRGHCGIARRGHRRI